MLKINRLVLTMLTGAVVAGTTVALTTVAATADGPSAPPRPVWVDDMNQVIDSKLPTEMPVLDSSGQVLPGRSHNAREAAGPPQGRPQPPSQAELQAERESGERRYVDVDGAEVVESSDGTD